MSLCYSCFKDFDDAFEMCPHCGELRIKAPKEAIQLPPGTMLNNRYIIGTAVGEGGFGIVYKAYDTNFECVVAIKEFFSTRLFTRYPGDIQVKVNKKSMNEFMYRKNRFLTEARYIAKYNANKNIVGVFDHFEENNTAYIVMELLKGVSLGNYLAMHNGRLEQSVAVDIASQVCNALRDLHKDNIIHCDIAPDNIFMLEGQAVKVFDFGAAKLADSVDVAIDICMKPGYSPPEQYDQSNNLGPWTDIYALGATLYLLLTGVKPDESTNRKISETVVPPNVLNPDISENLSNAIMKAMAVEKHMRFKNVDELMKALIGNRKVYSIEQEKKRRRLKRIAGIAASFLIVAGAAGLLFHTYSNKKSELTLKEATISVWYSVDDDSKENEAMEKIKADFESKFPDVTIELKAISKKRYAFELSAAESEGTLPTLFESSGLQDSILDKSADISNVLNSPQAKECLFIDQYDNYYDKHVQVPLAIEAPVAFIITKGNTSVDYTDNVFRSLDDFNTKKISMESECADFYGKAGSEEMLSPSKFMDNENNTSPVLLSSTMHMNSVRQILTSYQKNYAFLGGDKVKCRFTYEWSIGGGNEDELKAAETLLSWMLGSVYQNTLMISVASDGQIPVNETCFHEKCSSKNYAGMESVYENYIFE